MTKMELQVQEIFRSSKVGLIAGCRVVSGHRKLSTEAGDGSRIVVYLKPGDECALSLSSHTAVVGDIVEVELPELES